MISYVPIAVSGPDAAKTIPALAEIVLGPLVPARAEIGLREVLLTLDYPEDGPPTITRSTIPYRP